MLKFIDIEDPRESNNVLIAFTDGACRANGKVGAKGAYAVVWPEHAELDQGLPLPFDDKVHTNNRAELSAVAHAIHQANTILDAERSKTLIIYTDSMLVINSLTDWLPKWKRSGWKKLTDGKPVANLDLLHTLDALMSSRKVVFRFVRAHTHKNDYDSRHNARVDALAKSKIIT